MNPVYSPVQPGAPYGNPKNMAYTGYPAGYPTAAPTYNPNMYQTTSPGYAPGYTAGTPYKVPPTQSNSAPPPYSPSPNPYQTAMYPIRSAYPQQNLYAQGAYYTQPVYAAQPHVIHHTTVVQPNSIPSAIYPAPVAAQRTNGVTMGMVAGTTMAMSAGETNFSNMYHRIMELEEITRVHPDHSIQALLIDRWPSNLCLKTSREGDSTTITGSIFHCPTALTIRKFLLMFRWNLFSNILNPLLHVWSPEQQKTRFSILQYDILLDV
uniref:Family with sequence similarity 168 member A n=1 Tax=Anolis carolinensis TaxID=28377 RepID=A0A803T980_ANOCA